jgi:membrane protease YdiL (CAAX protease family)
VWSTISPRFGVHPDWRTAANRRRWPGGLALLFVIGLGGSLALLAVSQLAARTGYVNTLENELLQRPLVEQFLLVALLAPVVEELVFRLPLAARLRLGVLAAAGAFGLLNFAGGDGPVVVVAAVFALIVLLSGALWIQSLVAGVARPDAGGETGSRSPVWRDSVARWWESHPRWPVWCSVAAFGIVHLANYDVAWTIATVVVAPLVVSPQIWLGLMFTIARVRYGWWAGLVLHAFHNLAVWSVSSAIG